MSPPTLTESDIIGIFKDISNDNSSLDSGYEADVDSNVPIHIPIPTFIYILTSKLPFPAERRQTGSKMPLVRD
jgi:hypothetical protein